MLISLSNVQFSNALVEIDVTFAPNLKSASLLQFLKVYALIVLTASGTVNDVIAVPEKAPLPIADTLSLIRMSERSVQP